MIHFYSEKVQKQFVSIWYWRLSAQELFWLISSSNNCPYFGNEYTENGFGTHITKMPWLF